MRTASFSIEYTVTLPDQFQDADDEEIIDFIHEYWDDLIDGPHDCYFGDVTMID